MFRDGEGRERRGSSKKDPIKEDGKTRKNMETPHPNEVEEREQILVEHGGTAQKNLRL